MLKTMSTPFFCLALYPCRFLTIFAGVAPPLLTLRIWDMFMLEGGLAVTKVALALLTLAEKDIDAAEDPGTLNDIITKCPRMDRSADEIIKLRYCDVWMCGYCAHAF